MFLHATEHHRDLVQAEFPGVFNLIAALDEHQCGDTVNAFLWNEGGMIIDTFRKRFNVTIALAEVVDELSR
ncbi:hypothetical protein [Neorhodopirellula pilleata]|uniref:hypothetical protein n=1 Tax=Neorhodopirellula pilleata TaxID=2714738 RepID=UPI001E2CF57B|nr:hypothetical protein [Neorhodopirellula pilleata]